MEILPSQTLYIKNINEKIKVDNLKKLLYMLFRQHGKIVEIHASKGIARRGQVILYISFAEIGYVFLSLRLGYCTKMWHVLQMLYEQNKDLIFMTNHWLVNIEII